MRDRIIDYSEAQKEDEKPQEEKTHFVVHLVCAKRALNEKYKTKLMTESEISCIISNIEDEIPARIPLERVVQIQSVEYCNDTLVVTQNLAESLDYVVYGVYEGYAVE